MSKFSKVTEFLDFESNISRFSKSSEVLGFNPLVCLKCKNIQLSFSLTKFLNTHTLATLMGNWKCSVLFPVSVIEGLDGETRYFRRELLLQQCTTFENIYIIVPTKITSTNTHYNCLKYKCARNLHGSNYYMGFNRSSVKVLSL